ncbi:HD domain-containing protein [Exiguobacterium profundum]|uniref:HD domain-containing protein n=1 Tax=Exiguobacterium profundum TaxID=307643 RepID=UPI0029C535C7|nr:HD domain-containing protein [Exiguobacterium profundum]MDX5982017.1 HD domain-containing protein [Exiguobacterium profundum]
MKVLNKREVLSLTTKIGQLKVGDTLDQYVMIKQSYKGLAGNGKPYLTLILCDESGEIETKLWDSADTEKYATKKIVHAAGEVMDYRGRTQLKLKQISIIEQEVDIAPYVRSAPVPKSELETTIRGFITSLQHDEIRRLVEEVVNRHEEAYFTYPAAVRHHHAVYSGLALHVMSMLKLADTMCELYPSLNRDLLIAGVILHDLAKVIELSDAITPEYTLEGKLLGHLSLMASELEVVSRELGTDREVTTLLQHLVLSHHGKPEWGSANAPQLPEAEMLFFIDNIDARMNMFEKAYEGVEPGMFTERVMALDNRAFYRPNL